MSYLKYVLPARPISMSNIITQVASTAQAVEPPPPPPITESVDSVCRDTTYTQYKRISPNLRNGTLISLYNHIPFIFGCFHDQQDSSHREKPSRKYHTRYSQNEQIVMARNSWTRSRVFRTRFRILTSAH